MLVATLVESPMKVALSLICSTVFLFLCNLACKPLRSKLKHIPTPSQGWFCFRILHEPTVRELEDWIVQLPHQGLIRYYGIWNEERIFTASPQAAKDLLVAGAYKFIKAESQRRMIRNVVADGLLLQEGQQHKEARKAFASAFRADQIRRAYPIMWNSAYDLVNAVSIQAQANGVYTNTSDGLPTRRVTVTRLLMAATVDTFGKWGFSMDFNAVKDSKARLPRLYIEVLKATKHGQAFLWSAFTFGPALVLRLPIRPNRVVKAIVGMAVKAADSIVAQHEAKGLPAPSGADGKTDNEDMLSIAMRMGNFSHDDLVVHTAHFLGASTETTAGTATWAVHLLSRHPSIQERLRAEIRENLPSPRPLDAGRPFQEAEIHGLKYLDAVIQEVLRFHSINTILWRESIEPAQIAGTIVPKGTKVVFSPWATGRDPAYWGADAREFKPERWLNGSGQCGGAPTSHSFLTFGAGPRRCIGDEFAKAQLKCLLAGLIGRFEFSPLDVGEGSDDGQEIGDQAAFTLFKILDGWQLNVRQIEGW